MKSGVTHLDLLADAWRCLVSLRAAFLDPFFALFFAIVAEFSLLLVMDVHGWIPVAQLQIFPPLHTTDRM
jgi:hypothetical protein